MPEPLRLSRDRRVAQIDLVWPRPGCIERETIPPIPDEIAALMRDVSKAGKLAE